MSSPETEEIRRLIQSAISAIPDTHYSLEEREAWLARTLEMNLEERLRDQELFFRYESGQIIAFGSLLNAEIDFLYVHPNYWGKGHASDILKQIEASALSQGLEALYIHASKVLFPLLIREGFQVIRLEHIELGNQVLDRFEMRKPLGKFKRNRSTCLYSTDRLLLREMLTIDASEFYELNEDWEVLKYTGDVAFDSLEHAVSFMEAYDPYSTTGLGRYSLIRKDDGKLLGWCGLKYQENGEVDLGFRLFRSEWRKGYATEASLKCIELAQSKFGLRSIIGRVHPDNIASYKTLEKLGMKYEKATIDEGQDTLIYRLQFH